MTILRAALPCALALLLAAAAAGAQDTTAAAERRSTSVTVGVDDLDEAFESNVILGLWRRVSARADVGVEVSFDRTDDEADGNGVSTGNTMTSVEPGVRWYLAGAGRVTPYLAASLRSERRNYDYESPGRTIRGRLRELGATAAVGAEVRVVRRVSVGGHVGLYAARWRSTNEDNGVKTRRDGRQATTVASGLRVRLEV